MTHEFETLFRDVFSKNGLESYVNEKTVVLFSALTDRMLQVNRVMNLTALDTYEKIIPLHYADCAMMAMRIPQNAKLVDVGCGGGFPTLPLAILRPDLHITAVDSTEKKIRYVADTAMTLGLSIEAVSGRAEELAAQPAFRERFDVAISRAVARLNILDELCLPLVKPGGLFLTMKGSNGREEYEEAESGIRILGGGEAAVEAYPLYLADGEEQRTVISVRKLRSTDSKFPRAYSKMKKNPL